MEASTSSSGEIASSSSPPPPPPQVPLISYRELTLKKETELRIQVGPEFPLKLGIIEGTAEIFGTELSAKDWTFFPAGKNFSVFTWDGAIIGIEGTTSLEYTSDETPMRSYRDVHDMLEEKRNHAANNPTTSQGPRVIVIGPPDSGKTTLSMMLLSWAAKLGRIPLFVDLDVDQGSITMPGCIGAIPIEKPIDPVEGIFNINNLPIAYFYGHLSPSTDVDLYKYLLKKLAQKIDTRIAKSSETRTAGMIINTMGKIDGVESSGFLQFAISTFRITVALVLDEGELYMTLKNALKGTPVNLLKLQKSGGVVSRNPTIRSKARNFKVRQYFYGPGGNDHAPHAHTATFSDFNVFRIGYFSPANMEESSTAKVLSVLSDHLNNYQHRNHIIAVSFAMAKSDILSSGICSFIYVTAIDYTSKTFTYLTPTETDIPRRGVKFFSPLEEKFPRKRFEFFAEEIPRRKLLYYTPGVEAIPKDYMIGSAVEGTPNNCLIGGNVFASL